MDKKGDKSEFVTESVGIIVTIYFHVKILLKLVVKPLLHSVFSLIV